jgi:hypothetical protein
VHGIPLGLEIGAQHGADLRFVVDDEHSAWHATSC